MKTSKQCSRLGYCQTILWIRSLHHNLGIS